MLEKIIVKKCEIVRAENFGKKTPQKIPKKRFLYSHEYRDQKWGGKRAKQFFQKHTNSARNIFWGKNRWKKVRKHVFYNHMNIVT